MRRGGDKKMGSRKLSLEHKGKKSMFRNKMIVWKMEKVLTEGFVMSGEVTFESNFSKLIRTL